MLKLNIVLEKESNGKWYSSDSYLELNNPTLRAVLFGSETGDVTPITMPRGLPSNVSEMVSRFVDMETKVVLLTTWIKSSEFLAYPWDTPIQRSGIVELVDYRKLLRTGKAPDAVYSAVYGRKTAILCPEEVAAVQERKDIWYGVKCDFVMSCYDAIGEKFLNDLLSAVQKSEDNGSTRLVCWITEEDE